MGVDVILEMRSLRSSMKGLKTYYLLLENDRSCHFLPYFHIEIFLSEISYYTINKNKMNIVG